MKYQKFNIAIAAEPAVVWNVLWDKDSYPRWTSVFAPGSRAETDWKEGSKVLFVDGAGSGMVSRIEKIRENELMFFRHLGVVKDGQELTGTPESSQWEGTEVYKLERTKTGTNLEVELGFESLTPKFQDYFASTFPKALDEVKRLAETPVPVS